MAQTDTVERILDAAEALFAERGFAETSLRMITSRADVNLAAVNYYFGSKNVLIQAVFARFLDPIAERLTTLLNQLDADAALPTHSQPTQQELIALLFGVIMRGRLKERHNLQIFMRLLGIAYAQRQKHLQRHLEVVYGELFERCQRLFVETVPELPLYELYWRMNFMMGSVIFTMSDFQTLNDISEARYHRGATVEETMERLLPFLVAGLKAPL